jgi:uncharacterized membrane protein
MDRPPFLIPSIIFLIISIPLVAGKIPRNRFYGMRTRKTLSDERVWYAVNSFGGWLFIVSSLIYLGIAAFVPYSVESTSINWWTHTAGFVRPLVISIFMIHSYTKRL